MAGLFNITDADISASLAIIESHTATMRSAISEVEGIKSSVGSAFQSSASTAFQTQLNDWNEIYGDILATFARVRDDLNQANQTITRVHEDSVQKTTSLGSTISGVLAG